MNSKRIQAIASLVPHNSMILDIGTDHAYLPILLIKNNICKSCIASDISINALNNAKKNIKDEKLEENITLYKADGLKGIPNNYDVITISGMGTNTIKKILDNNNTKTIILSSNNNYYELRKFMMDSNYALIKEIVCIERNHYYPIMYYEYKMQILDEKELLFGISNNKEYYSYLKDKYTNISKQINNNKKELFKKYINYLDELLKEHR